MSSMEQYLEKGKEVLKILINNGCEAYLIGGAVCNTILDIPFKEIEVTTNATPDMVKGIFAQAKVEDEGEGAVRLTYMGHQFLVSTFRLEEKYRDNRTPVRLHYSKNLKDELANRDFTINAIAMSYGGKLTDAYRGYEDIQRKKVRTIGNPRIRFAEDPKRMLIALRLVSELGFKIDGKTFKAMKRKSKLVGQLKIDEIIPELERILNGNYFKRSLSYLMDSKIYKRIPLLQNGFKHLSRHYKRISIDSFLAYSYVLNKEYAKDYDSISEDPGRLKRVVELAIVNPKSKYDKLTLFSYGLEVCLDANYVNRLLGKSRLRTRRIKKDFAILPIQKICDLKFKGEDILLLTKDQGGEYLQPLIDDIAFNVLNQELENDYDKIKLFAIKWLRERGILPALGEDKTVSQPQPSFLDNSYVDRYQPSISKPYQYDSSSAPINNEELKIEQIERRVSDYERTLREKDEKIKELERQALQYKLDNDINTIVGQNLEILRDLNYLEKGSEKIMLSRELKEVYRGLITNVDPKYRVLKENETKEGNDSNNENEN